MRPRPGYDSRLVWLPAKSDAAVAVELAKRPLNDREKKSRGELKRHWYVKKKVAIKMILWAPQCRVGSRLAMVADESWLERQDLEFPAMEIL